MKLLIKALFFAAALVTFATLPTAAFAGGGDVAVNLGHGRGHDANASLFSLSRVTPGWQQSRTLEVRNDGGAAATLAITATHIIERENGCVHGEAAVDTTCGADQGELGHYLVFSIYTESMGGGSLGSQPVWSGSLYGLQRPVLLSDSLSAHSVMNVRIVAELPIQTGDEIETDQVGFGLQLEFATRWCDRHRERICLSPPAGRREPRRRVSQWWGRKLAVHRRTHHAWPADQRVAGHG